MAMIQSQSTSNPVCCFAVGGASRHWKARRISSPKHNAIFKERRDLCVSMLNQSRGLQLPQAGRRVLCFSVMCRRDWDAPPPSGKTSLQPIQDFVTELLQAEGVAVVQGTPFGFGPAFRISYATKTQEPGGGLPPHPAVLRQSAVAVEWQRKTTSAR